MNVTELSGRKEELLKIIQDAAAEMNYLIYESSVFISGPNSKIVIKLDSLQGISHNDCAVFSKALSKRIDDSEKLPNYSMEISSPGLSRKLRNIDEFKRFKGSPAKIVYESEGVTRVVKGIINNIIDTEIELKSDKDISEMIDYRKIKKANLEY